MNKYSKAPTTWLAMGMSVLVVFLAGCASSVPAPVRHGTPPPGAPSAASSAQSGQMREHVVQPGDTLLGIGRLYGQSMADIAAWNGLTNPNQISVGQRLRVSPPGAGQAGVEPVAIARPVEVVPLGPAPGVTAAAPSTAPLKQDPKGGKQPYSDQAWAAVSPDAGTSTPAPAATGAKDSAWLWPASGAILAGFNEASNKGLDIAGNPGDPVIASAGGKVVYSGSGLRGYGKLVIIKHDESYLTAYAHNRELLVKEGDTVTRGQKIAELGSTDADRPKLHFEIRKQGRPVDPMAYLPPR